MAVSLFLWDIVPSLPASYNCRNAFGGSGGVSDLSGEFALGCIHNWSPEVRVRIIEMTSDDANPVYIIGDIHGMVVQLELLILAIEDDARRHELEPRFLFVGDLVDKGLESQRAVQRICDLFAKYPGSQVILGNHDEVFLEFLSGEMGLEQLRRWLVTFKGIETVRSYRGSFRGSLKEFGAHIRNAHCKHWELFENAVDMVLLDDNYCAVHAGIHPSFPLEDQRLDEVRWIRDRFLDCEEAFERIIIHGHTPTSTMMPEVFHNRIAIDCGSAGSRTLGAVVIAGRSEPRFIEVGVYDERYSVQHYPQAMQIMDHRHPSWAGRIIPSFRQFGFSGTVVVDESGILKFTGPFGPGYQKEVLSG